MKMLLTTRSVATRGLLSLGIAAVVLKYIFLHQSGRQEEHWAYDVERVEDTETYHFSESIDIFQDDSVSIVEKRAPPEPFNDEEIAAVLVHGSCVLQPLMFQTIDEANTMISDDLNYGPDPENKKWQRDHRIAADKAWSRRDTTGQPDFSLAAVKPALDGLTVGEEGLPKEDGKNYERDILTDKWPAGPNRRIVWTQDQEFNPQRNAWQGMAGSPPTGAVFENVYNIIDGVIITQMAITPAEAYRINNHGAILPKDENPKICTWSDATFGEWVHSHSEKTYRGTGALKIYKTFEPHFTYTQMTRNQIYPMQENLNWIIQPDLTFPEDTLRVIARCLRAMKFPPGEAPPYDTAVYPVGHWCFSALIGSSGCQEIAYLLINHKAPKSGLGHKCIKAVMIFKSAREQAPPGWPAGNGDTPSLLWQIVNCDEELKQKALRNNRVYSLGDPPLTPPPDTPPFTMPD